MNLKIRGTELTPGDSRQQYREKLARITLDSMVQFVGLLDAAGTVLEINFVAAYSGREALDAAATFAPEVALLDIGMPGLNGYEVAREMRAARGASVVLVAVTGWGQDEDRRLARAAGFDHHLAKPVDPDALKAFLGTLRAAAAPRDSEG